MTDKGQRDFQKRLKISLIFLAAVFLTIAGRLWYLQIIQGEEYLRRSEANALRVVPIPAPRGIIYDRNLIAVANNRMAFTVSIIPRALPSDPASVFELLGEIVGVSASEIATAMETQQRLPYYPVRLFRDVSADVVTRIEEARLDLPGVIIEETPIRKYPWGEAAGQTLGYLGLISEDQLKTLGSLGYSANDIVGRTGLEFVYETVLRGVDGGQQVEVNRVNRPIRVLGQVDSVPGKNLILTIDIELQDKTEKILKERLAEIRAEGRYPNAFAGSVVVIDPQSGQILAMASEPGYDPAKFVGGVSRTYWQELVSNPYDPLRNRVTQGDITPGSVFKVVTALAALSENKTTPWEIFDAKGYDYVYPQKSCWIASSGRNHGKINVAQGLRDSCNIVFYEIGRRSGIDSLNRWAHTLGFGEKTGINLYPVESSGLVPSREWKKNSFKRADQQIWYPIETLDVSIGQGALLTTPLQMAVAYSAIANGGTFYEPALVQAIMEPTGEIAEVFNPVVRKQIEFKPQGLAAIRDGLRQVITQGTARSAFVNFPIPVSGKTGTAELSKNTSDVHGWFACYAPTDDPEVVVVVALERAGGGGGSAAPVARRVLEAYYGLDTVSEIANEDVPDTPGEIGQP